MHEWVPSTPREFGTLLHVNYPMSTSLPLLTTRLRQHAGEDESLPLLTTRLRQHAGEDESILARQWRLLKLMIFSPKGFTIKELVALSGVSEKTVHRDLIFLKEVGFDVSETVEDFGRKLWRVRRLPEMSGHGGRRERNIA